MNRPSAAFLMVACLLLAGCMGGNSPKARSGGSASDLVAAFEFSPALPSIGEEVGFRDKSTGTPTAWEWSFGDGTFSPEANPSHAYQTPGAFDVYLTVEDVRGNVAQAHQRVTVAQLAGGGPNGFGLDFTFDVQGRAVEFEPVVTPRDTRVEAYVWSFGDGASSTDSAPRHAYAADGAYTVVLRARTNSSIAEATHLVPVGVFVADGGVLAKRSWVVVAVIDSGINPYHEEFRDPSFDIAPAHFVEGFPTDAVRLPLSMDARTYAAAVKQDDPVWKQVKDRRLYWIPGTRIIGALSASMDGPQRILDNDGHGTITASNVAGTTVGSCPSCLIVVLEAGTVEGLQWALDWAASQPWIDVITNSWNLCISAPGQPCYADTGVLPSSMQPTDPTKRAVEAGKGVFFAAGNGVLNSFDVPQLTWANALTGPDWVITVGAAARPSGATVVGTGRPVDVTAPGVDYPGASHTSLNAIGEHRGTSLSAPVAAGAYATALWNARVALGDVREGPRASAVVAQGLAASASLADGKLTRAELERAFFLSARRAVSTGPLDPLTLPDSPAHFAYAGYGLVDAKSGKDAYDILSGAVPMPAKANEDSWAQADGAVRRAIWGSWNPGSDAPSWAPEPARVQALRAYVAP